MKLISILLLFLLFTVQLFSDDKIYFLPQESKSALQQILKEISKAKNSIEITIYNFTHKKIANRLKDVAKRGIKVKIIFDYDSSKEQKRFSMLYYLAKYKNITTYRLRGKYVKKKRYFGKMHQKIALIDNKILILGSANWSYSGFGKNYEVVVISHNKDFIKKYHRYFEKMKRKANKFL